MAESQVNPKGKLASQVDFVGADHRFATLGAALADFIPLNGAKTPAVEASASVVVETHVSEVEATASLVPAPAAAQCVQSDEATPMSDEDCLSLGSGGNISPIRQEEKDLLDGRSWAEEMDQELAFPKKSLLSEAVISEVVACASHVSEGESSVDGTAGQASAGQIVIPEHNVLERRISKVAKRAAQVELSRQTTTHNYDHYKEFMCAESVLGTVEMMLSDWPADSYVAQEIEYADCD